jgi:hypothetical protein
MVVFFNVAAQRLSIMKKVSKGKRTLAGTEENWNFRLDQLANRAMVPEERNDIVRFIDFRFKWNERSKF